MSMDKLMNKEVVVHMHNWMLFSHKKGWIWVSSSKVHEPRACYIEWSKSERDKCCVLPRVWNLEGWCWWTYLQGSNGDADREQTYGHSGGRRGGNKLREEHWNIHITICEIDSQWGFAVWHRELNVVLCNNLAVSGVGCGGRWERGSRVGDIYIYIHLWLVQVGRNQHNIVKQWSSS